MTDKKEQNLTHRLQYSMLWIVNNRTPEGTRLWSEQRDGVRRAHFNTECIKDMFNRELTKLGHAGWKGNNITTTSIQSALKKCDVKELYEGREGANGAGYKRDKAKVMQSPEMIQDHWDHSRPKPKPKTIEVKTYTVDEIREMFEQMAKGD